MPGFETTDLKRNKRARSSVLGSKMLNSLLVYLLNSTATAALSDLETSCEDALIFLLDTCSASGQTVMFELMYKFSGLFFSLFLNNT